MSYGEDERVVHCPGPLSASPCGRYVRLSRAVMAPENGGWVESGHWSSRVYMCPKCHKAGVAAKLRALLLSGERPHAEWNDEERAMASAMLGAELASKRPVEAA